MMKMQRRLAAVMMSKSSFSGTIGIGVFRGRRGVDSSGPGSIQKGIQDFVVFLLYILKFRFDFEFLTHPRSPDFIAHQETILDFQKKENTG